MSKRIWKYQLSIDDAQTVGVPAGSTFLDVQIQHGQVCVWALVDPDRGQEERQIRIYGTGHEVPDNPGEYLGTFQALDGDLVFHVFAA